MSDQFMADLHLLQAPELDDQQRAILVAGAESFLRGGGVVAWDFWKSLLVESRAAFIVANEKIWKERVVLAGLASQGADSAAAIAADFDGGDMQVHLALRRISNEIRAEMKKDSTA